MALSLATVGGKVTAAFLNLIVGRVNRTGLVSIIPTSVVTGAGVTLGSTGVVTFTAASVVSVNGCFTAEFDNYRIVTRITSKTAIDLWARLRVAGVDQAGTTDYRNQFSYSSGGATATTAASNAAAAILGQGSLAEAFNEATIASPWLTAPTIFSTRHEENNGTTSFSLSGGARHGLSVSADGLTLIPSATGTMTGTLRIYGYNN